MFELVRTSNHPLRLCWPQAGLYRWMV